MTDREKVEKAVAEAAKGRVPPEPRPELCFCADSPQSNSVCPTCGGWAIIRVPPPPDGPAVSVHNKDLKNPK